MEKFNGLVTLEKGRVCAIIKDSECEMVYDLQGLEWMVNQQGKTGVWEEALEAVKAEQGSE